MEGLQDREFACARSVKRATRRWSTVDFELLRYCSNPSHLVPSSSIGALDVIRDGKNELILDQAHIGPSACIIMQDPTVHFAP